MVYRYQVFIVSGWLVERMRIGYKAIDLFGGHYLPLSNGMSWGKAMSKVYKHTQLRHHLPRVLCGWYVVVTTQFLDVMIIRKIGV